LEQTRSACSQNTFLNILKKIHKGDWKTRHPEQSDILDIITASLKTPARWDKAIQHLKERNELTDSPKDIGPLMKEISVDVLKECEEYIKDELFKWAWKKISGKISYGFPEYYKQKLVEQQFEKKV
jgi:hypothetical protein